MNFFHHTFIHSLYIINIHLEITNNIYKSVIIKLNLFFGY